MADLSLFDGFSPRRMTADEYVAYIETGRRELGVHLPDPEDYEAALNVLVERGVIDARTAAPALGSETGHAHHTEYLAGFRDPHCPACRELDDASGPKVDE